MIYINGAYGRLAANTSGAIGCMDTFDFNVMFSEMIEATKHTDSKPDGMAELTEALDMLAGRMSVRPSAKTVILEESAPGAPPLSSLGCPCPCPDSSCVMKAA